MKTYMYAEAIAGLEGKRKLDAKGTHEPMVPPPAVCLLFANLQLQLLREYAMIRWWMKSPSVPDLQTVLHITQAPPQSRQLQRYSLCSGAFLKDNEEGASLPWEEAGGSAPVPALCSEVNVARHEIAHGFVGTTDGIPRWPQTWKEHDLENWRLSRSH